MGTMTSCEPVKNGALALGRGLTPRVAFCILAIEAGLFRLRCGFFLAPIVHT
jgi:hypothetical protein